VAEAVTTSKERRCGLDAECKEKQSCGHAVIVACGDMFQQCRAILLRRVKATMDGWQCRNMVCSGVDAMGENEKKYCGVQGWVDRFWPSERSGEGEIAGKFRKWWGLTDLPRCRRCFTRQGNRYLSSADFVLNSSLTYTVYRTGRLGVVGLYSVN
jgi:hypothetical protein